MSRTVTGARQHVAATPRLRQRGRPLEEGTRALMEGRFGADFGGVRVHDGVEAAAQAAWLGARAWTSGSDIGFAGGAYTPATAAGGALLAHELTHVLQQRGGGAGAAAARPHEAAAESEAARAAEAFRAGGPVPAPSLARSSGVQLSDDEEERTAAPAAEAEAVPESDAETPEERIGDAVEWSLDPARVRSRFRLIPQLQLGPLPQLVPPPALGTLPPPLPPLSSGVRPPWLTQPPLPAAAPLVPRGAGPATPRAGTTGDVFSALFMVPAIESALAALRADAARQARLQWAGLSTGEQVLFVSHSALLGAAVLGPILANDETRGAVLGLLRDRDLPVPFVPGLSAQFRLGPDEQRVLFTLKLHEMIPGLMSRF